MIRGLPKVEKLAGEAAEHLPIFDGGVKIASVRQCIGQVVSDLFKACLEFERGIPGAYSHHNEVGVYFDWMSVWR
jgi:hypothetical protein